MNEYHLWALKKLSYAFSSVSYKQLNSGKATTHASGLDECRSYPKTWSKQYFGQSYQPIHKIYSEFCCYTGTFTTLNIVCLCRDYTQSCQTCAPQLILLGRLSWLQHLRKRKKMGENEGKTLLTKRGKRCKKHLLFGEHSKKIQSLLSRLPVKIQLPSQPRLGLNFIFFSLLRGKIDKRPSSKCVWGKDFQPGGFPPPPSFPGRSQSGSNSQAPLPTPTEFYTA